MMFTGGSPTISDCMFIGNEAAVDGGGLNFINFGTINRASSTITNCVFFGNQAQVIGGGVASQLLANDSVSIENCTFSSNQAPTAAGMFISESLFLVENTIIAFSQNGEAIGLAGAVSLTIEYSDLYGNAGGDWTGAIADQNGINGNISEDPLFVDAEEGNLHLTGDSPCIDAGNPGSPQDPDGTSADMGAFYFDHFDLDSHLSGGELVFEWTARPGVSAYWVYGVANHAYFEPGFAPGYEHRLDVVPPGTTTWTSSNGIGDAATNWTYLVVAVDVGDQEIVRSNRAGEHDFFGDIP